MADYEIQQFNNGGTAKTATFRLQGTLASKQKFLVGRSELQTELGNKVNQVAALSFNGDDAVVLVYKGTPVDRFTVLGNDLRQDGELLFQAWEIALNVLKLKIQL